MNAHYFITLCPSKFSFADNYRSNNGSFASGNVFSYQSSCGDPSLCWGGGYHDFAINTCCGVACVRWGYIQNNEVNCASNDVAGGIGLGGSMFTPESLSCGDFYGCCGNIGINTAMYSSIWGRRT